MIVTPTLHFHGQCEEATWLYKEAFDFRLHQLLRYSDADKRDWDEPLTEEQLRYVYHAEGYIGKQRFMLSDELLPQGKDQPTLFLTLTFETPVEVERAFAILSEKGRVLYPLRSTTYSSAMGTVIDPFGFRWGLMTEKA